MRIAEHILLESDLREVPNFRAARKVHARIGFRSRLRRRFLQLEIIDYYYLAVRSRSRSTSLEYVLDAVRRHAASIAAHLLAVDRGFFRPDKPNMRDDALRCLRRRRCVNDTGAPFARLPRVPRMLFKRHRRSGVAAQRVSS
jgi:hypothetical protein